VKEAAEVTLKVSPEDYDYLREHLAENREVEIVADPAVAPGGVVVLSDIGHIDGEIMHRFERIKEAVFGTVK
jgi:flagellar assembly protein FliH